MTDALFSGRLARMVKPAFILQLMALCYAAIAALIAYECGKYVEHFFWEISSPEYFLQGVNGYNIPELIPFFLSLYSAPLFFWGLFGRKKYSESANHFIKKMCLVLAIFFIFSIAVLIAGMGNCFYLSESRIDYRALPNIANMRSYGWDDVEYSEIECLDATHGSTRFFYTLHLKDSTEINIATNSQHQFFAAYGQLQRILNRHAIPEKLVDIGRGCAGIIKRKDPNFTPFVSMILSNPHD